jgi:hypothetical protein
LLLIATEAAMPAVKYVDFDIQISRDGDRYLAEVRSSPAGTSSRNVVQWPFENEKHEMLLLKLENAILRGRGYRSGPISGEERILREFGSEVYQAVFRDTKEISDLFAASRAIVESNPDLEGLRVKLRVEPPELAMLPWEYVFDASAGKDKYLCLKDKSPVVRFLDVPGVNARQVNLHRPLRILCMIANPGHDWELLDTEAERRVIDDALKNLPKAAVSYRWVQGGAPDDLFSIMQDGPWDVFHFIGHGGTDTYLDSDGSTRTEGYLVMQDGLGEAVKVSASRLSETLEDGKVRLAVLNCCESGRGSAFSSAAAALVKDGVPLVVAMQFPITNDAASRFSGMFYQSLVRGHSIEKALTISRRFMRLNSNVEWGIPVLFTRATSCALFEADLTKADVAEPTAEEQSAAARASAPPPSPEAEHDARRAAAQEELRRLWERA